MHQVYVCVYVCLREGGREGTDRQTEIERRRMTNFIAQDGLKLVYLSGTRFLGLQAYTTTPRFKYYLKLF
jgi:hypothetical protein